MPKCSPSLIPFLLISMMVCPSAFPQAGGGSTLVEKAGIALVKPQAWSKNSEATVLEFTAYTDRTATGNASAGYYQLRTKSGQIRQIPASRALKVVIYPDKESITDLVEKSDRDKIQAVVIEINEVMERFPATRTYLAPKVKDFSGLLTRFDAGEVKKDGQWVSRTQYLGSQATRLADMLTVEVERAKPPGSFPLEADPKYLALRDMQSDVPAGKVLADKVLSRQQSLARASQRAAILQQLASPALPLAQCRKLVAELGTLTPGEDPESRSAFELWDLSLRNLDAIEAAAGPVAEAIEKEMGTVQDTVPALTPKTSAEAFKIADRLKAERSKSLPPQMLMATPVASSVAGIHHLIVQIPPLFEGRRFLEAKTLLDKSSTGVDALGPNASRVLLELQRKAAASIEVFVKTRDEAKMLAEAGKTDDALAKYREAYEIIPESGVAQEIEALSKSAK